jgi:hypothetical protein
MPIVAWEDSVDWRVRTGMRPILIAFAACLLLAAGAAPASAARVERLETVIQYSAAAGDVVDVFLAGNPANVARPSRSLFFRRNAGGTAPAAGTGCINQISQVRCQLSIATLLRVTTLEGDDKIDVSGAAAPFDSSLPSELRTGDGADTLTGGPPVDTMFAGAGDDRLAGGGGADQLHGEGGDDVFTGLDDADVVDGGPGTDLLDLSAVGAGMRISLDGVANDGALGATAAVSVEHVRGTATADQLVGGDGRNELRGEGGDDLIVVRGGGADLVDCGPGTDRVEADVADFVTSCEFIDREPPPAPPADGPAPGTPPALVDADRDGVVAAADCDDTRANVRPGATDVPGNKVDEDCTGGDAAFPLIPATIAFEFLGFRDGTQAEQLYVRGLPAGGRAELRCEGKGCRFARKAGRVSRRGRAELAKLLRGRRLRAGVVLEVRATAPGFVGKVRRFRIRARGRQPVRTSLCLAPGRKRPGRCP